MGSTRGLLATLIVISLVAVGCGQATVATPMPSVTPRSSPLPSDLPGGSAAGASPTATLTPSPEAYAPTIGSSVVTVSDRLRVRSKPEVSDDSLRYEPLLPLGTELRILEGPVSGSGYVWYRVAPMSISLLGGVADGWVAIAGSDGEPWIAAATSSPPSPSPLPSLEPTPEPNTAPPPLNEAEQFFGVAWSGTQFVLAGITDGAAYDDAAEITFWTSPDGVSWATGDRSVGVVSDYAFGSSGDGVAVGFLADAAAAWVSSDGGTHWTRVPEQPAFLPVEGEDEIRLRSVALADAGYVAIGESGPWAVVLVSADGLTWSRSDDRPAMTRTTLQGVAAKDDRFVIVGKVRQPQEAKIWTSVDGASWSEAAPPDGFLPDVWQAGENSVVAGPAGFLLLRADGRLWSSEDGLTWTPTAGPPGGRIDWFSPQLFATPWGFIAIARESSCDDGVWASDEARQWTCITGTGPGGRWFAASLDTIVGNRFTGPLWVASFDR